MDGWWGGDAYERYMGRWSARVAEVFLKRLSVPRRARWLDVGCGTGALTGAVLRYREPGLVLAVDPSERFLSTARTRSGRAGFAVADARALPVPDHAFDAVVSGLALNFVPEPARAVAEFARAARPGGVVAAYVWDYGGGMAMLRAFWDAAAELDPAAAELDEGRRFPLCRPGPLMRLWADVGPVSVAPLEITTRFADFDDYWTPFLGGQGPAPGYVVALPRDRRERLRNLLRERLPSGPFSLPARAWAVTALPVR
ncbi:MULTISPECIES: class I SAM-dependent methyltransferase [Amycolatopsis]|uniref:Methyltransferase domain-containing protein n=2 Tax=Amycolatopsis TaxID=1813 RepID=A0A1I4BW01_9PSEU|nr:class I SAM-dependent methyltransferase [Amycolatopsis sacchari]SFK72081.1 Methyltransferase domain-containing protein [Amycolatopsis sacchari]